MTANVSPAHKATQALFSQLGTLIEDCPQARELVQQAVSHALSHFAPIRKKLLSDDERNLLVTMIVRLRQEWEASGDAFIAGVTQYGYLGWKYASDEGLIEEVFVANPGALAQPVQDKERLDLTRLALRDDVLACAMHFAGPDFSWAKLVENLKYNTASILDPVMGAEADALLAQAEGRQHEPASENCEEQSAMRT